MKTKQKPTKNILRDGVKQALLTVLEDCKHDFVNTLGDAIVGSDMEHALSFRYWAGMVSAYCYDGGEGVSEERFTDMVRGTLDCIEVDNITPEGIQKWLQSANELEQLAKEIRAKFM